MNYNETLDGLNKLTGTLRKKNKLYTNISTSTHMLSIFLSASIPILIDLAEGDVQLLLVVSIFSAIMTLIQTFRSTFHIQDKIQTTAVSLAYVEKEKLLFETQTAPYNQSEDENVHAIITKLAEEIEEGLSSLTDN